jgi:uncharacterized protein (DUF362 family)
MNRRNFIRSGLGALGGLMLPWKSAFTQMNEPVSVAKSRVWMASGDPLQAARTLAQAVGGLQEFIPQDGVVLVKPNIGFATPPGWGATTDPDFLAAMLDLCIEEGARRVIVIDHPVGSSAQKNLDRTGIGQVCAAREKVQVLIADTEKSYQSRTVAKGKVLKSTMTARLLDKVDLFINIPTAKHHAVTGVSLGLKNLMGLIWDRVPFHEELDLHQAIADLATVIHPRLTFLDARYALLSGGPTGPGQVEEVGHYLAGFDPLAVDAVGVTLARWEGRIQKATAISHLSKAYDLGVGEIEHIEVIPIS